MSISVGTIVTRYNSYGEELSCEDGTCVGIIIAIEQIALYPDNPNVVVEWLKSCNWHGNHTNTRMYYKLDQTWEIGQMPRKV